MKITEEQDINLTDYCIDIQRFSRAGDFSSAQLLVSGLRKYIAQLKKDAFRDNGD